MYKIFEFSQNEQLSHKDAFIRYDFSEFVENEVNEKLMEINNGSIEEDDYCLEKANLNELCNLMTIQTFLKYLESSDNVELNILLKDNSNKSEIEDLIESENLTPSKAKKDLKSAIEELANNQDGSFLHENVVEDINNYLSEVNTEGFYIKGRNMGWRSKSGYKICKIRTGQEFMEEILPKTDCTFYLTKNEDNSLLMKNYHHDAPTGESYDIIPITLDTVIKLYGDKETESLLEELLENTSFSANKKEDEIKLFNMAIAKDSADDISTLLKYSIGPSDESEAASIVVSAVVLDKMEALNQYMSESAYFFNATKKNKVLDLAISYTSEKDIADKIEQLKEEEEED